MSAKTHWAKEIRRGRLVAACHALGEVTLTTDRSCVTCSVCRSLVR